MRVTPKISDRPAATRNSEDASASPFRSWTIKPDKSIFLHTSWSKKRAAWRRALAWSIGRAHLLDFFIGRLDVRTVDIAYVGHDALAVLLGQLAHVGAHGRLMVDGAVDDLAKGRLDLEALEGLDHVFGVGGATRLLDAGRQRLDRAVAHDGAQARIVVELGLVGVEELLVLGRIDGVP